MAKPGFAFLWKQKVAYDDEQLNSLTEAVLMDRYIGYRGFRSLAHLGASGTRYSGSTPIWDASNGRSPSGPRRHRQALWPAPAD